jgi:hypothetical protein
MVIWNELKSGLIGLAAGHRANALCGEIKTRLAGDISGTLFTYYALLHTLILDTQRTPQDDSIAIRSFIHPHTDKH